MVLQSHAQYRSRVYCVRLWEGADDDAELEPAAAGILAYRFGVLADDMVRNGNATLTRKLLLLYYFFLLSSIVSHSISLPRSKNRDKN